MDAEIERERLNAKAASMFPKQWAKATRSKQRYNLRQHVIWQEKLAELRQDGARCDNCNSYSRGGVCDLESDFYGIVKTMPDGLCTKWSRRE